MYKWHGQKEIKDIAKEYMSNRIYKNIKYKQTDLLKIN